MEFESEYIEKQLDRDYFGVNGYIDGEGVRRKREEGEVLKFEESQDDEKILIIKGDDSIMEFTNLQESIEAFLEQGVEEEYFSVERALTEETKKTLLEAMNILNKYKSEIKANKELKEAIVTLARYIGYGYPGIPSKYPYPAKKIEKAREPLDWLSVQEMFFGKLEKSDEKEISKSDITDSDPFPSLSKQFKENEELIDEVIETNNIDEGERFI